MLIYLVHGFNEIDAGDSTINLSAQMFRERGFKVKELKYGFAHLIRTRLCNKGLASIMAEMCEPGAAMIAYSNGAAIAHSAAEFGIPLRHLTLVNPALQAKLIIPNVPSVHVWYAPSDPWTGIAKYRPFTKWGQQGKVGYVGEDERYTQFNIDERNEKDLKHGGIWKDPTALKDFVSVTAAHLHLLGG